MAQTEMNVKLLAHTQLSSKFGYELFLSDTYFMNEDCDATDGQAVALTAIRTCYSPNKPSDIVVLEGEKYFGDNGKEGERLFNHIVRSGHTSTLEHVTFTFAVEGVSRSLLAQLTRHRVGFSYSVQSQRYVKFGVNDKSNGFDYAVPEKLRKSKNSDDETVNDRYLDHLGDKIFYDAMDDAQRAYDRLRKIGIPAEDARAVLPNAAACNLVMTVNLRSLLDFYAKRRKGRGAQSEIAELAEALRREVVNVEPWTDAFFEGA